MKKLITLLAVLLFGTASVFAQYDVVNEKQVALVTNTEDWGETGTTFTAAQTGIENWCDSATSTPSLRISVLVEMALITDPNDVYCYRYGIQYNKTCNWCSSNTVSFSFEFD